jgi:hypothetical protein
VDQKRNPDPIDIFAGIFSILCGLCLLLVGGGCTTLWIAQLVETHGDTTGFVMLAVSIGIGAAGLYGCYEGFRKLGPKDD